MEFGKTTTRGPKHFLSVSDAALETLLSVFRFLPSNKWTLKILSFCPIFFPVNKFGKANLFPANNHTPAIFFSHMIAWTLWSKKLSCSQPDPFQVKQNFHSFWDFWMRKINIASPVVAFTIFILCGPPQPNQNN